MDTATVERRAAVEFRFDGRTLTGPAVTYGDVAQGPKGPERFEARAFVSGLDSANLVLQHDARRVIASQPEALAFTDTPQALDLRASLRPDGAEAQLVRRGTLGGLSVGFVAIEERQEAGVRVISGAHLDHVALVDRPAYPASTVELRQLDTAAFVGAVRYGTIMQCECVGDACSAVQFEPGSLDQYINGAEPSIAVAGGGFSNVIAATARNTMSVARLGAEAARLLGAVQRTAGAGVQVVIERATTRAAQALVLDALAVPLYLRPIVNFDTSLYSDIAGVRHIERADIRAWLLKATTSDRGHLPVAAAGVATGPVPEPMTVEQRAARRRIWL